MLIVEFIMYLQEHGCPWGGWWYTPGQGCPQGGCGYPVLEQRKRSKEVGCSRKKVLGIQPQPSELLTRGTEMDREWPSAKTGEAGTRRERSVWFKLSLGQGEENILSVCIPFSPQITWSHDQKLVLIGNKLNKIQIPWVETFVCDLAEGPGILRWNGRTKGHKKSFE